jgi:plasmid maintenance system antidote protein VapI
MSILFYEESMAHDKPIAHGVYNPNRLLDTLIERMNLNSDNALSKKLKVAKDVISSIRHGQLPIAASMLIWMHEATGISICELRALMGDRRTKCRLSYAMVR